jgi:hypothetical protein
VCVLAAEWIYFFKSKRVFECAFNRWFESQDFTLETEYFSSSFSWCISSLLSFYARPLAVSFSIFSPIVFFYSFVDEELNNNSSSLAPVNSSLNKPPYRRLCVCVWVLISFWRSSCVGVCGFFCFVFSFSLFIWPSLSSCAREKELQTFLSWRSWEVGSVCVCVCGYITHSHLFWLAWLVCWCVLTSSKGTDDQPVTRLRSTLCVFRD